MYGYLFCLETVVFYMMCSLWLWQFLSEEDLCKSQIAKANSKYKNSRWIIFVFLDPLQVLCFWTPGMHVHQEPHCCNWGLKDKAPNIGNQMGSYTLGKSITETPFLSALKTSNVLIGYFAPLLLKTSEAPY